MGLSSQVTPVEKMAPALINAVLFDMDGLLINRSVFVSVCVLVPSLTLHVLTLHFRACKLVVASTSIVK